MPVNLMEMFQQRNPAGGSFDEIERRRAMAQALGGAVDPREIRSNEQGIAHVLGKVGEAYGNWRADRMEGDKTQALASALGPMMESTGLPNEVLQSMGPEAMANLAVQIAGERMRHQRDMEASRAQAEREAADPMRAADLELKRAQIEKTRAEASPDARKRLGLNPQYGVDANGNPVLLQIGENGEAVQTRMPEGITLSKEPIRLDAGTHWVLLDPISRQPVGQIPKNVGEAAAAQAAGKVQGEALSTLPAARITADETRAKIDELLVDPNLSKVSGVESYMPDWLAGIATDGKALDLRRRVEQLRGTAFLEAYNGLRGGGQITEVEGKKAEDALARLDSAQTDAGFRQALTDFRDAVERGYAKLAAKSGQSIPATGTNPSGKRWIFNPATGELE